MSCDASLLVKKIFGAGNNLNFIVTVSLPLKKISKLSSISFTPVVILMLPGESSANAIQMLWVDGSLGAGNLLWMSRRGPSSVSLILAHYPFVFQHVVLIYQVRTSDVWMASVMWQSSESEFQQKSGVMMSFSLGLYKFLTWNVIT